MSYHLYLFALLIVTCCCTLFMSYLAWKRRMFPISISYGLGMLAGAFYSFGYAFELVSTNMDQVRFWLRIEYIGISFGTFFWIIMVLHFTGRQAFLRKWTIALLAIIPIVTFISHYTNEWHHLFYKSTMLDKVGELLLFSFEPGPLYKIHVAYSYMLFVIGMGLLLHKYSKVPPHKKKQIMLLIVGSCGPYGITLIYLTGIFHIPVDISPFGFLFSGIFLMWGIYQFNFLKLAPLVLQKVFESMQDAVIVFDMDYCLTSYNQSASQIIPSLYDRRIIGRSAAYVLADFPDLLQRIKQAPSVESKFTVSNHSDIQHYNLQVVHVKESSQMPVGIVVLLSDVTEAVLAEETLRNNARQLSELNTFKDKMFNVVAHDIRDPLAVLTSLMELMRDEIKICGQDHEEVVHEMGQQIHNTFTLVESLLDWFRSQSGGMMFTPVVWNLSQAIQSNIHLLKVRSDNKRIHLVSEIASDTFVYADKEMLDLIIRNLLSNAIKFTNYGGSIVLTANQVDGKVIVSISDTGQGISQDRAHTLFQDAYPTSSIGTAGERGVGLGLTLCREFVRINGGDIWFDSRPDHGSNFYFSIPTSNRHNANAS
jgi:signal transduction histidine kinase